jgi:hypothetical protein
MLIEWGDRGMGLSFWILRGDRSSEEVAYEVSPRCC